MVPGTNAAGLPQFDELQRGIDEAWVRRTLQELIRIRSENPLDEPPGPGRGEQEIADYLCDLVSGMGVRVEQREAAPGRPNVYAYLPGRRGDFTLALAGHTDTVEAGDFPAHVGPVEIEIDEKRVEVLARNRDGVTRFGRARSGQTGGPGG